MKRGFFLSITAAILLIVVVSIVTSTNRSADTSRELSIARDRARTTSLTLERIQTEELPAAAALAFKESVVELGSQLTGPRLEQLSRSGSSGSYAIAHPLDRIESRGDELFNDPIAFSITSFDVTSVEQDRPFSLVVTYDLTVRVDSPSVHANLTYTDRRQRVSIVGVEDPANAPARITKGGYVQDATVDCYLKEIGLLSSCGSVAGVRPEP